MNHRAEVFKSRKSEGSFDIVCQKATCRFELKSVTNYAGQPASYEQVKAEADHHTKYARSDVK